VEHLADRRIVTELRAGGTTIRDRHRPCLAAAAPYITPNGVYFANRTHAGLRPADPVET
jgi:hypothetical protein